MLFLSTYLLSLALLCHRSLAYKSLCQWSTPERPKMAACEAALSQIDLTLGQHWQRVKPVVWMPRQHRKTREGFPTCGQRWSSDGCAITLHCTAKTKMTLREIYMVSSDAVKRCVSRDQRQSHGALGYLDRESPWWISITEKAMSYGTPKANANNVPVEHYFAHSHRDSVRANWQRFRGPGRVPGAGAGAALRGQGSNEANNEAGQVVPADSSQPNAYLRDFPPYHHPR